MWDPAVVHVVKKSSQYLAKMLQKNKLSSDSSKYEKYLQGTFFPQYLGIQDSEKWEIDKLMSAKSCLTKELTINSIINQRARIGWTTHGHTGVDINLYAYGHKSEEFVGNFENTEISKKIAKILKLDVEAVTKQLQEEV